MPSTITAPTMPAGLKAILDINLDFITNNKNPLITKTQDLKDDDGNQLEPVYTSGPIKELIEGHLDSKFHSTPIINFDVTFFTWNFSPRGASKDSLYNTFGWERKQKLIEFLVDVQLLNGVGVSLPNNYKYDIDDTTHKTLFEDHLSVKLSYEAKILRRNVLSWIYERMMNDYQAEIDAWNGWFDQYPAGLDFGVSLINTIKNLATPSSSNRALIKVGGKTTMMTTSSEGDEDGVDMNEYRFDSIPFFAPIVRKYCRYSITYTMEAIKELKKIDFSKDQDLIPLRPLVKLNPQGDKTIDHYFVGLTEQFNEKFINFYKNQVENQYGFLFDPDYDIRYLTMGQTGESFKQIGKEKLNAFYNYSFVRSSSPTKAIQINECTDDADKAKLLEGVAGSNFRVINIKLNLPKKVREGFSYSSDVDNRLSRQIVIDISKDDTENKEKINTKIILALEEIFTPFAEMNKPWWYTIFSRDFLFANLPDFLETSKLFLEWRRSQIFYGLDTVKGDFERLADVTNTVPGIMQRTMSYLNSGHYFDENTNVQPTNNS